VCPLACCIPASTQNRVSTATAYGSQPKTECTVRYGGPPYPFLGSIPIRVRYPTRLAFLVNGQPAECCCNAWYTLRGFHHRTCLMQACAHVGNGVQPITGGPVHTTQASVLTVLVVVLLPRRLHHQFSFLIGSGSSKGCLICHQCT